MTDETKTTKEISDRRQILLEMARKHLLGAARDDFIFAVNNEKWKRKVKG